MPDFRRSRRARRQSWYGAKKHTKTLLSLPVVHGMMRTVAPRIPRITVRRLPAPLALREVQAYADGASFFMLRPDRCEIAKELYWGGGRRPEARDAFAIELMTTLSAEARTFLDIGAYTGIFTLAATAAHRDLQARAFELVPPVAAMLRANVERNGVGDRVVVHEAGVGDPEATMRVPVTDTGSALPSFYSSDMSFDEGEDVGFLSLDSLTEDVLGPVTIKIDVEGGEVELLAHGQRFLGTHRPDILCEVLADADGARLEELLSPHGLRFYAVGAEGLRPRERLLPDPEFRDWLFTRRTPQELRERGVTVIGG